jgi:periplasmic protein TonB
MSNRESGSRGRIYRSNPPNYLDDGSQRRRESYNSSSLALDFQDASALQWQPSPQWVARPRAAAHPAPEIFDWRGLNLPDFKRDRSSTTVSFLLHLAVIAFILWLSLRPHAIVQPEQTTVTKLDFTLYAPPPPPPPVMPVAKAQGGGGGEHTIAQPRRVRVPKVVVFHPAPPKIVTQHLAAPQLSVQVNNPRLALPTAQVNMPDSPSVPTFGASQSPQIALAAQGANGSTSSHGLGGGLGSGPGNGVGSGGGYGGGLMSVGGGVSAPQVIHSVEPDFTEEARRANFQGEVSIQLIVDAQGNPQNIHVVRHLGMGLDDRAIAAVKQYRFRPAMFQGHPVAVQMVIEVAFRLH